jgi:hypothetical protein
MVSEDGKDTGWVDTKTDDIKLKKENDYMEYNFNIEKFKEDFYLDKVKVVFKTLSEARDFASSNICSGKYWITEYCLNSVVLSRYSLDSLLMNIKYDSLYKHYPLKQKSLFEQALGLIGLKVGEEFYLDVPHKGVETCIIDEEGAIWYKILNPISSLFGTGCVKELFRVNMTLSDLLLNSSLILKTKPKSEAELILDELEKVVDKANGILERSGR